MHTKTEQYKGFPIEIVSYDGLGVVSFHFFVKGDGFKSEGYATLNAAKGAITNHLKLKEGVVKVVEGGKAKPATSDDKDYTSVPAPRIKITPSRNQREGGYAGKVSMYKVTSNGLVRLRGRSLGHIRSGNGKYVLSLKDQARHMDSLDACE